MCLMKSKNVLEYQTSNIQMKTKNGKFNNNPV